MVKISNKVLLAGGLATAIGVSGCKKYEDGPMFSLLTKKQRLTGEWDAKKIVSDGINLMDQGYEMEIEFDKDGDFEFNSTYQYTYQYYSYYGGWQTVTNTYNNQATGEWEFSNDKEEIELDYDGGGSEEWEITRLTNKELEADITINMKKKLFPELEANSKSDIRVEFEKQ